MNFVFHGKEFLCQVNYYLLGKNGVTYNNKIIFKDKTGKV
jgi:hypothetical protein